MAASNTTSFTLTDADWTLIADGATVASVAGQIDPDSMPAYIAIAQSKPAVSSNDYVVLDRDRTKEFSEDLNSTDKVYAKAPAYSKAVVRVVLASR